MRASNCTHDKIPIVLVAENLSTAVFMTIAGDALNWPDQTVTRQGHTNAQGQHAYASKTVSKVSKGL
jgi:hypothetical protein